MEEASTCSLIVSQHFEMVVYTVIAKNNPCEEACRSELMEAGSGDAMQKREKRDREIENKARSYRKFDLEGGSSLLLFSFPNSSRSIR